MTVILEGCFATSSKIRLLSNKENVQYRSSVELKPRRTVGGLADGKLQLLPQILVDCLKDIL